MSRSHTILTMVWRLSPAHWDTCIVWQWVPQPDISTTLPTCKPQVS